MTWARDTWRERLLGATVCRIVGHRPRQKMSCRICDRCRVVLSVRS